MATASSLSPLDYYSILDLARSCSSSDINSAYRRLSLKYHPSNPASSAPIAERPHAFRLVSEAYDVLSHTAWRSIFDQFGESGLKEGIKTKSGGETKPYLFTKNPEKMFEEFFGTKMAVTGVFTGFAAGDEPINLLPSEVAKERRKEKMKDLIQNVEVTLEELYSGCQKKQKITRNRLTPDGVATVASSTLLTLSIGAGFPSGTRLTFPGEGDESPGYLAGDVVFILQEQKHPAWRREGFDLIWKAEVSLWEALNGTTVSVKTLDNRTLPIAVAEVPDSGWRMIIDGEGMMKVGKKKGAGERGRLILEFLVKFPTGLSVQQKAELKKILK